MGGVVAFTSFAAGGLAAQIVNGTGLSMEWVERFGGWAVVIWIVFWLTRRWERQMERQHDTLGELLKALDRNNHMHTETRDTIRDALRTSIDANATAHNHLAQAIQSVADRLQVAPPKGKAR
jgi:hypothetical protein